MQVEFGGRVLVIGCGYVARCTIPLLLKHLKMPPKKITVMDFVDNRESIADSIKQGVKFVIDRVRPDNLSTLLGRYVGPGDMILDLAWNIGCEDILQWCHDHDVMYLNTSVELWDPYSNHENLHPTERTLYVRHMGIRHMVERWESKKGATAVIEHGANPGLVSYFVKLALEGIAKRILSLKPADPRCPTLEEALGKHDFPKLAQLANVQVIHISERDSQVSLKPKEMNEFVNTWSIEGFREEGIAPAEMGWGVHERRLPNDAFPHLYGPQTQICIARMGIKTWVRSWVPSGETTGMVVRHGEAFTIADHLTVWDGPKPVYRPTVHYAYCPCDAAINSLHELEMRWFELQERQRIITDEISSGRDELGVLLMGHDFNSWWTGSLLDIEEARRLVPHQNATTLQVACSILAATVWMIRNPERGVCVPDDLPYQEILEFAMNYLGPFFNEAVDWTPLKNRVDLFSNFARERRPPDEDVWQFDTFRVR